MSAARDLASALEDLDTDSEESSNEALSLQRKAPSVPRRLNLHPAHCCLWLALELLFCLYLTNSSIFAEDGQAAALHWIAAVAWLCFLACLGLRAGLLVAWRQQALGDAPLSVLFQLGSSLPFLLYVALHLLQLGLLTRVATEPQAFLDRATGNCTRPYAPPPSCDGAVEAYRSSHTCCLVYVKRPQEEERPLAGPLGNLLSWTSVLAVMAVWRDVPFDALPAGPVPGLLWLDVLDAVVFSELVQCKRAVYPALGIDLETGRSSVKDGRLLGLLWFLWTWAFATALLAAGCRLLLRCFLAENEEKGMEHTVGELERHVRLLDEETARSLLGEALREQRRLHLEAGGASGDNGFAVALDAPAVSEAWGGSAKRCRRGLARMLEPGLYSVELPDGGREVLGVERLQPLLADEAQELEREEEASCEGWCDPASLGGCAPARRLARCAKVADALRSLLCLDLPFLCARWFLELREGRVSLWLLKNALGCVVAVATIAACGDEGASCLHTRPLRSLARLVGGSAHPAQAWDEGLQAASAGAGALRPAGFERDLERLKLHRAWLLVESDKAEEWAAAAIDGDERPLAARGVYEAELRRLELEMARVASQLRATGHGLS